MSLAVEGFVGRPELPSVSPKSDTRGAVGAHRSELWWLGFEVACARHLEMWASQTKVLRPLVESAPTPLHKSRLETLTGIPEDNIRVYVSQIRTALRDTGLPTIQGSGKVGTEGYWLSASDAEAIIARVENGAKGLRSYLDEAA